MPVGRKYLYQDRRHHLKGKKKREEEEEEEEEEKGENEKRRGCPKILSTSKVRQLHKPIETLPKRKNALAKRPRTKKKKRSERNRSKGARWE
jgi:hypothetical protein